MVGKGIKAPSINIQDPEKIQIPSSNPVTGQRFGFWCLDLLWILDVDAWSFSFGSWIFAPRQPPPDETANDRHRRQNRSRIERTVLINHTNTMPSTGHLQRLKRVVRSQQSRGLAVHIGMPRMKIGLRQYHHGRLVSFNLNVHTAVFEMGRNHACGSFVSYCDESLCLLGQA